MGKAYYLIHCDECLEPIAVAEHRPIQSFICENCKPPKEPSEPLKTNRIKTFVKLIYEDIRIPYRHLALSSVTALTASSIAIIIILALGKFSSWIMHKPFDADAMEAGMGLLILIVGIGCLINYFIKAWKRSSNDP